MGHRLLPRRPELYHGRENSRPYFEGWYFKQASKAGAFSVIPGVYRGKNKKDDTAFIQAIFGRPAQSFFVRYPFSSFSCEQHAFELRIGANYFSLDRVILDIEEIGLKAKLNISGTTPLSTGFLSPSIMGWFSYFPAMQCNHGVLSLRHEVNGFVSCGERQILFDNATGYIEKDWGEAFPDRWIWMQCGDADSALMCAVASIPYGPLRFNGIICALLANGRQYRFATYNGARIKSLGADGNRVTAEIGNRGYLLSITSENYESGNLKAPSKTGMDRDIFESIDARYDVELRFKGDVIFSRSYERAGLEMLNSEKLLNAHNIKRQLF